MNKLVSRNPVQRFKQGRKILKGADGLQANKYGEQAYFLDRNGKVFKGHIDQSPENKRLTQRYKFNGKQYGSFDGGKQYYDLSSLKPLNYKSNQYLLSKINSPKKENMSETSDSTKGVTTPVEKNSNNSFKLAFDTARNSGEQEFTWNGRKFNTMKKGETKEQWLSNLKPSSPELPTSEQLIQQMPQNTPIVESVPQAGTNTIQNQLSLMQQTLPATGTYIQTPTYVTADRSQTRDWMRSNGINPYSVTGAMRAAARRIRAGQANDNDRLLVKGNEQLYNLLKGYYKQGGTMNILPSRNIVERFKQRNFR